MKRTIIVRCGVKGCKNGAHYEAQNQKEAREIIEQYGNGKYRCAKHTNPEKLLSLDRKKITSIQIAEKSKKYPNLDGLYWNDGSGFIFGPGFKAFADDFPAGTKLIVTAEIMLPK